MPTKVLIVMTGLWLAASPALAQTVVPPEPAEVSQASTPPRPPRTPLQILTGQPAAPAAPADPVGENLFPPELVMAHQKAIGLDDVQKNAIRSELLKTQTHFTELQWQLQDAMEPLVALLKEEKVDEQQVLAQLDKVLNAEREIKRTQISLAVRIKNRLTPEQQGRLREFWQEGSPRAETAPR